MEEANLSERGKALYGKLHVSRDDIEIARSCARYIKRKGWHTYSFRRRGTVRIQQVCFTTTMIVVYARPFAPGRGNIDLPKRLAADYESDQKILHKRLLQLRHTEYAHLDASSYRVTPYKGDFIKSIESIRDVCFTEKEIDLFLLMTDGLLARITERMEQLRLGS
jgi:hypothetical protein